MIMPLSLRGSSRPPRGRRVTGVSPLKSAMDPVERDGEVGDKVEARGGIR